ncbi:Rpn family recombination-promoting nuclease/putative transposase [Flavitalea flava]
MKKYIQPYEEKSKFIDPLTDFGFKRLFGSEPNKEMLIAFLNALLDGEKHIVDLTYNRNEYHGPSKGYRKSVFDLTCTGQDGDQFMIEVQRGSQKYFKDRAIYYTSTLIHDQGPKGKRDWDFNLTPVYLIGLMEFCFEDSEKEKYMHWAHIVEKGTGKEFYAKLGYIFCELPKFEKQENDLNTDLDRWLYILKNMSKLQKIPVFLRKPIFENLFNLAETANLTKEEYMQYQKSQKQRWDDYAVKTTAENKLKEAEIKVKEAEIKVKEAEIKVIEAREEGRLETQNKMVKKMLIDGRLTIPQIANLAEVSEEFIIKIRNSVN